MSLPLEVTGLCFGYGPVPVLSGISFRVHTGETIGVVGANGSGKSTLLWCIAGLLGFAGEVRIFGRAPDDGGRRRLGLVFQNPEDQLFMPSLADDLTLPLKNAGTPADAAREAAMETLRRFGLENCAGRPAQHLSLGQRKRAAIGLALVRKPELLLLDEPTAELDGAAVRRLKETLKAIESAKLIASHDLGFLAATTARLLVLSQGSIAAKGPTGDILADRRLLDSAGLV